MLLMKEAHILFATVICFVVDKCRQYLIISF